MGRYIFIPFPNTGPMVRRIVRENACHDRKLPGMWFGALTLGLTFLTDATLDGAGASWWIAGGCIGIALFVLWELRAATGLTVAAIHRELRRQIGAGRVRASVVATCWQRRRAKAEAVAP